MQKLKDNAKVNEGIDPYMNLSFVSLPVIGNMRLLPNLMLKSGELLNRKN